MQLEFVKSFGKRGLALTQPEVSEELDFQALSLLASQVRGAPQLSDIRIGRGGHGVFTLPSGRRIFVREYCRGGLVRYFNQRWFLNFGGETRPFAELKILQMLSENGVRVPKPLAAAVFYAPGKLFYSGLIVLEHLDDTENLLLLGYGQDSRFGKFAAAAGVEARKALDLGVLHPDLHPGNVLLKKSGEVVLIDFDKSIVGGACRQRLVRRWEKSLSKHHLTELEGGAFKRAVRG